MPPGLDALKHIVVLMMENRSFDHLLGDLKRVNPNIDGLDGTESNPDTANPSGKVTVQANAEYQAQLQPDPGHHFDDVKLQLFGTTDDGVTQANMQGFVKSYFSEQKDVAHSHGIMSYFPAAKVPVISRLAQDYAVFTRWFSSLPGPTLPNRAFAHFGTSFGNVDMTVFYLGKPIKSIYERMLDAKRSAKIYYYDDTSGSLGMAFMLKNQPKLFDTLDKFYDDCKNAQLPDYSFLEPNYSDHDDDDGSHTASDQHPDHNVLEGEKLIFKVYDAIRRSPRWENTLLLIVYDEHGGIYDHVVPPGVYGNQVVPPAVAADGLGTEPFVNQDTGFKFDRLGVRVPAIAISPWIPPNTIVSDRIFDHASIPATVAKRFIQNPDAVPRSNREKSADTFLDLLSLGQARNDPPRTLHLGKVNIFAASDPATINLDETPAEAYDPNRTAHKMLLEQVQGMYAAEQELPVQQQTGTKLEDIKTERDAGRYIKLVMQRLRGVAAAAAEGSK
jgi:phospholipase C